MIVYNLTTVNTDVWNLKIYGSGTTDEILVPYSDIVSDKYLSVQDGEFVILNKFNFTYTFFYSGASIWDILEDNGVVAGYATQLRFVASDNYKSEFIPLSLVRDNPNLVIIGYEENGKILEEQSKGGTGPLRSMVNLSVTIQMSPPTYNSQFWVKYVNGIEVI